MTHRDTDELIRSLAGKAKPVRLLQSPLARATGWLGPALLYVAFVVVLLGRRGDLASKMADPRFVIEAATALSMAFAAAIAACATVVPGYSRMTLAALLVPLAAWLGSLGFGCVEDWITLGSRDLVLQTDWSCFPAILVTSGVPTIAIAVMLRRGAPLTPTLSMALGGLAAGALADFGMRFHHREAGVMVLVWHVGAVFIILGVTASVGRHVLKWRVVEPTFGG